MNVDSIPCDSRSESSAAAARLDREAGREGPAGGGERKGKAPALLPTVGVTADLGGGGSRDGSPGEGGAGHCLPFVADAPERRLIVGV